MCDLGQRDNLCNQAYFSLEGYCWSWVTDISVNDFTAFLSMERCKNSRSWEVSLKNICQPGFPGGRVPHSRPSPLNSFQGICRSETALLNDSFLWKWMERTLFTLYLLWYWKQNIWQFLDLTQWHFISQNFVETYWETLLKSSLWLLGKCLINWWW